MSEKTYSPIIFVWIGSSFPKWGISSINFAVSNNPNRKIILLLDKKAAISNLKNLCRVDVIYLDDTFLRNCDFEKEINLSNNFWINTAKRLIILNKYCRINNIVKFFHAEIDNLVFDLEDLEFKFNSLGFGLFAPKDNSKRALASLIFCNRNESINEILRYFYPPFSVESEMEALGLFAKNSSFFFALPTESFSNVKNKWQIISPKKTNGIFDAAAMGQYILGIDPIHEPYKPLHNMFINENVLVEFKDINFYIKDKNLFLYLKDIKETYKIFNLHIHSKKIHTAIDMVNGKNKILKNLSIGKKTIIANRHKLFSGKIRYLIHLLKINFKNLINL